MGRLRLDRVRRDITLPRELSRKADELAIATGEALSHLIERVLRPHVEKHWTAEMARNCRRRK